MDKTIILDCQAKVVCISCEDCIVFKECSLSKKSTKKETDMEIFVNVGDLATKNE